jgi:diketogulonate reductase-like aldo/keto reductase
VPNQAILCSICEAASHRGFDLPWLCLTHREVGKMEVKKLITGEEIPVLGLGTWRMGGSLYPDYSQDSQVVELIQTAIQLGYTHIDTAELYADGHTEELIGRAVKDFPRESLFITTKVWHTNLSYSAVLRSLEGSLKRLGSHYVDFCLIHYPDPATPLQETFKALNELVANGKVRYLGVSNFSLQQMQEARAISAAPIVTNQVPYNLYNPAYRKNGVLKYCQEQGVLLTAYSPFDRGTVLNDPEVKRIAALHGKTTAQVALAWLIRQPGVITIPMSGNRSHLKSNLEALDIQFSREEIDRLNNLEMPEEALWPE